MINILVIFLVDITIVSSVMRKPAIRLCKQKGTDQPAHQCSLISAFAVHCLEILIKSFGHPK